jgi:hypothetical protein
VPTCGSEATLVVTQDVQGTSTNVVRRKVKLRCQLPLGHGGAHRDVEHEESWEARREERPTLLRHEDPKT